MQIEPFRIAVPEDVLVDLRTRLARTRLPDEIPGSGWDYGTNLGYLRELVAYWRERYDWRAEERRLNAFPQFRARVGDLGVHFIHARGVGPKPLPLLITHGWPGSVAEFTKIIPLLTDPARARRRPGRRLRRRLPVDAGLRLLGSPDDPRHGPRADRRGVDRADARPRLPALRRAGRRLGQHGVDVPRRAPCRRRPRRAPELRRRAAARPAESRRRPHAGGADPADAAAAVPEGGDRLPAHPVHQAADARLRAQRLTRRSGGMDRREVPHLERLRRRRREALHQGRAADQRDALLGDGDRDVVVPPLLRGRARRQVPAPGRPRRGADRLRDLPARDTQAAAQVGGARLQRDAAGR